ncbi:MAG: hypothetical protein ACSHXJ_04515 [Marinomonas colpomeniae]
MNIPHPPSSSVPRKELTQSLQKGVVALLFILVLAFVGLYMLISMNLEKQNLQKEELSELIGVVHDAEEHWLGWLLIEEKNLYNDTVSTPTYYHHVLVSEYGLIEQKLDGFDVLFDISRPLALLELLGQRELDIYSLAREERETIHLLFSILENLENDLVKIGVDLDYERQLFIDQLVWAPVVVLLLLALMIIVMTIKFSRQLSSGFSSLHYILDHHKHGHALLVPSRKVADEFTDLVHFMDNELASRNFDLKQKDESFDLIEKSLTKVSEPFFIANNEGDIVWMSAGAERLWFKNTELFETMFGIDSGLDDPIGERIIESFFTHDEELTLKLSDGVYCLQVHRLALELESESGNLECFISIKLKSEVAELQILHHSLKLMGQDVWDVPIRMLRSESPYESFAVSLEVVRRRVIELFGLINESNEQTPIFEKITKLQQIASLIDEKPNQNGALSSNVVIAPESSGDDVELNEVICLSEQIRDSLLLGYELVLQRLALIEKDLSSDVFLLENVERCLNEVRAGVLSSLSAAEGQSDKVRRRFSIDIEHDISKVQNQIEGMRSMAASTLTLLESDRSVGLSRLNRASSSIDEIVEKVHKLMGPNFSINNEAGGITKTTNNASDNF